MFTKNTIIALAFGKNKIGDTMFNTNIENNITVLDKLTRANENFDIIKRVIRINKRKSVLYFIDGLLKEATTELPRMTFSQIPKLLWKTVFHILKLIKVKIPMLL